MRSIVETATFSRWIDALEDRRAVARIAVRIDRLAAAGHAGDAKPVGDGISELRIDYGPGYRVYFTQRGNVTVILLCGGDKSTQAKDIARARALAKEQPE